MKSNSKIVRTETPKRFATSGVIIFILSTTEENRYDSANFRNVKQRIDTIQQEAIDRNSFTGITEIELKEFSITGSQHQWKSPCIHCKDIFSGIWVVTRLPFTLHESISFAKENNSKLFVCFLDAQKAFYKVCREGLFLKLFGGKDFYLWEVIVSLHDNLSSFMLFRGFKSMEFNISLGTRQGGVPSPYLFLCFYKWLTRWTMCFEFRSAYKWDKSYLPDRWHTTLIVDKTGALVFDKYLRPLFTSVAFKLQCT